MSLERPTDFQARVLETFKRTGSVKVAAAELNTSQQNVRTTLFDLGWDSAKRAEFIAASHEDPAIAEGMDAIGTEMEPVLMWVKTKNESGTSHSVMVRPKQKSAESLADQIKTILEGLVPAAPVAQPAYTNKDLLTLIPLTDVHIGQLSWAEETGSEYNTEIACERVREWVARVVDAAPACGQAIILSNGDLFHTDDQTNQTPAHKHQLDSATRFFRTLDLGIAAMAYAVDYALAKNDHVTVDIRPGNHDVHSYMHVLFALDQRYRNEPRVKVNKVPGEFFIFQFDKCLLASHHGHRGKPQDIVLMLAHDYAKIWGQTQHRYLYTGHKHHLAEADIGGVQWKQLRPQTERDAHAKGGAYISRAQLLGITYHRQWGEVQRVSIGPR